MPASPTCTRWRWTTYIQLTEAEAAFRALKSELAVRPVFHQLERRAKAHLLVAFLGYALWVTLKHLLHRRTTGLTPARALTLLPTQLEWNAECSGDFVAS